MQSILRWSIENSTPLDATASDRPPTERKDLDPGVIDLILGKPDAVQMKEDMDIAMDVNRSEDDRISALDHLEMLIEHIDNANDLEKLKLWEPLQSLLTAESSTPEIKTQVLWVIGTALQNNPSAQDVYLSYNPLPTLLSFLDNSPSSSTSIRSKAIYTLSGLLKHNSPAVKALSNPDVAGWVKLRNALQDPSISVRRKVVFLLSSLLIPTSPTTSSPAPPTALRIADDPNASSSTSVTSVDTPNIMTPDQQASSSEPIFANSHAANLQNPSRTSTSSWTLSALHEYGLLDAVISSIVSPIPYGDDGENVSLDADYEEKAIHVLHAYSVTCRGPFTDSQKGQLKSWIQAEKQKEGENHLLEKWNMSRDDYAAFFGGLL
ncbi:Fes1-domain-containing protein [Pholiota conissans]|uniref:Fes1-domain-containing protein n=1 Tax=Pholiota conissans TaxID=109636 RepID=A0A9P6D3G0_9AGAR|nr:Fes1-domain-containing protein [Pholiota conissans]